MLTFLGDALAAGLGAAILIAALWLLPPSDSGCTAMPTLVPAKICR